MPEEKNNYSNQTNNPHLFKKYFLTLSVVALIFFGFYFGYSRGKTQSASEKNSALTLSGLTIKNSYPENKSSLDFSLFWKVWNLLKEKYYEKDTLDAQKMMYGAIKGMLEATGDPYSNFFDPKETESFAEEIRGSFEGIGAELGIKDELLTIVAPLENSPAEKAGLRAGDKIIKIEDQSASEITVEKAVELIRGKKGTSVKLTIFRKGEETTREIIITRDTIEIKSVKLEMKENNIAYLKINEFGEETTREFRTAASQIISANSPGIILDLRNNPGGFVDKCVDVANLLISKGKTIVIEEDSSGNKISNYTQGGDSLSHLPLVVLINEGSASASEILAGALRDNRQIPLIGKKSFGKGSVQEYTQLPGKTSVKITVAKWLTPNGDSITEKGILPDIEIDYSLEDFNNQKDPQFDKAMEKIKEIIGQN